MWQIYCKGSLLKSIYGLGFLFKEIAGGSDLWCAAGSFGGTK